MDIRHQTDWMEIIISPDRRTIMIRQRWQYQWDTAPGASFWSYQQKKKFHDRADALIWQQWGGKYILEVTGSSDFAKAHANQDFVLNFDIQWVLDDPHWEVIATKIKPGTLQTSKVKWNQKIIILDSEDIILRERDRFQDCFYQYPVSHEFGHAIGNVPFRYPGAHWDEYKPTSSYYSDKQSIMNIGNELRQRHIDYILKVLNAMIPNTIFSYEAVL